MKINKTQLIILKNIIILLHKNNTKIVIKNKICTNNNSKIKIYLIKVITIKKYNKHNFSKIWQIKVEFNMEEKF